MSQSCGEHTEVSNGHSKLSPSSAHRWTHCTASVSYIDSLLYVPSEDSPYAQEGTLAHETFATALGLPNPFEVEYRTPAEKEFLPRAIEWVQNIRYLHPKVRLYREIKVDPAPFVGTSHCKGTADVIIPVNFGPLYVADLKFGEHVAVDVVDNLQLILYALGALAKFELELGYIFTEVVIAILQPRAYHPDGSIREWRVSVSELRSAAKWVGDRAREALNPSKAVFAPDSDGACRFCPAQGQCVALAEHSLAQARDIFTDIVDPNATYRDPQSLTPAELSFLLDSFVGMRRWMGEVSAHALSYCKRGGTLPYYQLASKLGNRAWAVPEPELNKHFTKGDLYELKLRSPAQVEKMLGRHSVDDFVKREETGETLKRIDEPNPVESSDITNVFGEIQDAR